MPLPINTPDRKQERRQDRKMITEHHRPIPNIVENVVASTADSGHRWPGHLKKKRDDRAGASRRSGRKAADPVRPPSRLIRVNASLGFSSKARSRCRQHALKKPSSLRCSHGNPVPGAASATGGRWSGAARRQAAGCSAANSQRGRQSAMPDCQPKSVGRNWPVRSPSRICFERKLTELRSVSSYVNCRHGPFYRDGADPSQLQRLERCARP